MKLIPTHRKCLATAWLVLALGVSGFLMIARRPPVPSNTTGNESATRVFKTKNRQSADQEATRSPAETVADLAARRPSPGRDQSLIHAVSQWADEAPADALAWIEGFPHGELHEWLTCAALTAMAEHDPAQAASFLETEMPDGQPRNHAIVAVTQRWAQHSPDDARQWVDHLGASSAKDDALREIAVMEAEAGGR